MSDEEIGGPSTDAARGRGSKIPFYSATSPSGWGSSSLKVLPSLLEPLPRAVPSGLPVWRSPSSPLSWALFTRKKGRDQGSPRLGEALERGLGSGETGWRKVYEKEGRKR